MSKTITKIDAVVEEMFAPDIEEFIEDGLFREHLDYFQHRYKPGKTPQLEDYNAEECYARIVDHEWDWDYQAYGGLEIVLRGSKIEIIEHSDNDDPQINGIYDDLETALDEIHEWEWQIVQWINEYDDNDDDNDDN